MLLGSHHRRTSPGVCDIAITLRPGVGAYSGTMSISAAGSIQIKNLGTVTRLGFGAMRITGEGIWGEPADRPTPGEFVEQLRAALADPATPAAITRIPGNGARPGRSSTMVLALVVLVVFAVTFAVAYVVTGQLR